MYVYIYVTLSHLRSKKTGREHIAISFVAQLPPSENALMRNGGCI